MRRADLVRAAALCACAAVAALGEGCGTSQTHTTGTSAQTARYTYYTSSGHAVHYLQQPARLATQPLPGGAIHLLAGLYTQVGEPTRAYLELSLRSVETGGPAGESPAGNVSIPLAEPARKMTMRVERSCLAGAPYSIAFGWLRSAADRVVATNEHGTSNPFHRVTIPSHLRAGGVLVYRLLEGTATTVLTTTPSGHVVRREPYGAGAPQHCPA